MAAGKVWLGIGPGASPILSLAVDPVNPATIYAGTRGGGEFGDGGAFKSTDGGNSWTAINSGLRGIEIRSLVIDPQNPTTIYAGGDGVFKSTDAGGSWTLSGFIGPEVLAIDPQNPATIYAGTYDGVYRSTDGGSSWSTVLETRTGVYAIAIDPQNPTTIYAGGYGGVFRTTDGASSWILITSGLPSIGRIGSLAIDPQNPAKVYAGTDCGVFESLDGGSSWTARNSGLTSTRVLAQSIAPQNPTTVYASTDHGGIFRLGYLPALKSGGAVSYETPGEGELRAGYANVTMRSGATPYGIGVISLNQHGAIISEAGIPASPPTTQARIFIDFRKGVNAIPSRSEAGSIDVNTGIAVLNPGSATANVTYILSNVAGEQITTGHGSIAAGKHFACFIDELKDRAEAPDFNLPADFPTAIQFASLDITSSQPLSVLALRGTMSQRNEFLVTTTPIANLNHPPGHNPIYLPQFVDGGGYTTSVILLNTSGLPETGTLAIANGKGEPLVVTQVGGTFGSAFKYSIPPGGVFRFQTDGFPAGVRAGWARLTPDEGTSTPAGLGVFGYNPADILVSESGIPTTSSTTHAHVYVDLSRNHNTGLALANLVAAAAAIKIKAFELDGTTSVGGVTQSASLVPNGYAAAFAGEFVSGLPAGFKGVLDISSETPFAALTLRTLVNERHEFLMTSFPVANVNAESPAPIVFPQVVNGGGYTTEAILISTTGGASTILSFYSEDGARWDIEQ